MYQWRLWSIAEIREAMPEAGFVSVEVDREVALPPEQMPVAVTDHAEMSADWVVLVVGRAS